VTVRQRIYIGTAADDWPADKAGVLLANAREARRSELEFQVVVANTNVNS